MSPNPPFSLVDKNLRKLSDHRHTFAESFFKDGLLSLGELAAVLPLLLRRILNVNTFHFVIGLSYGKLRKKPDY